MRSDHPDAGGSLVRTGEPSAVSQHHDRFMGYSRLITTFPGGTPYLACSPSSHHNRRLARIFHVITLSIPLVAGCSDPNSNSRREPDKRFSRAAVVALAVREWRLFGAPVNDDDHLNWDKPERNDGLWQRVGEYWSVGMNPGVPEALRTGKHDEYGREFAPEDDEKYAWSAAFVSYVMRIAGTGRAFPYAADHATYINAAKRMTLGTDNGWLITAERPSSYAPVPGDLICRGRNGAASLRYDDLPTAESFPAHCDIVVGPPNLGTISVIGGNVQDTVTMRHIPVAADGKLAGLDGAILDQRQTWMTVLRVHESNAGSGS
jgi:hypothetical protein